ncbi:MAG: hypothetical protein J6I53_12250 [Treponema sp.]|nr:hypothetical protein [Treponema sp.]
MKERSLFSNEEMRQPPLTQDGRESLIHQIVYRAHIGCQYMYGVKETAGLLHITYDEMRTLLNFYKLDCTVIRDTIVRIPWWSLAEYLIDPADDMETALQDYLKSLPHRKPEEKLTA